MYLPHISTYLGNRLNLTEPDVKDVAIEDIAHGLAFQCRFNGQTREFYSVAQHSLMVMSLVGEELKLTALLHDAAEAFLGDMVTPLKRMIPGYADIETVVLKTIGDRFGVNLAFMPPDIKRADLIALATERRDLMHRATEPWSCLSGFDPLPDTIKPMGPAAAESAFLDAFNMLTAGLTECGKIRNGSKNRTSGFIEDPWLEEPVEQRKAA